MTAIAMVTLPNCGSTWLAEILEQCSGLATYYEFFNPLQNPEHEARLADGFGCETATCTRWLWDNPGATTLDQIHADTWEKHGYQFTKEVFSPTKLHWFAKRFRPFVLVRGAENLFPPSRLRVWSFYEHIWESMRAHGVILEAKGIRDRAREAHGIATRRLVADAQIVGAPVIHYEALIHGTPCEVEKQLDLIPMPTLERRWATSIIVQSRRYQRK